MVHGVHVDRVTTTSTSIAGRLMRAVDQAGNSSRGPIPQDWTVEISPHDSLTQTTVEERAAFASASNELLQTMLRFAGNDASDGLERSAEGLARLLVAEHGLPTVHVRLKAHLWRQIMQEGAPRPSTFMKGSEERQSATCTVDRGTTRQRSGFEHMTLLQLHPGLTDTSPSELARAASFPHFRLIRLSAEWSYTAEAGKEEFPFNQHRQHLRESLISAYAELEIAALPQSLRLLAQTAFKTDQSLAELTLRAPTYASLTPSLETPVSEAISETTLRRP